MAHCYNHFFAFKFLVVNLPPPSRSPGQALAQVKDGSWGFPGGSVVKNPPANAGDSGSIPDPGRSHALQSN